MNFTQERLDSLLMLGQFRPFSECDDILSGAIFEHHTFAQLTERQ